MKEYGYTGKAMGTEYFISIVCSTQKLADELYNNTVKDINAYEDKFSRFKAKSELSILNKKKSMNVSQVFFDVAAKSNELFVKTKGIFNPLVQIERLGYNKNFSELREIDIQSEVGSYDIDFSSTSMDGHTKYINLSDGQKIDFGGFLKGYLAEMLAKKIMSHSSDIFGVIVNLGGDIHTQGLDENGNVFVFNIFNPIQKDGVIEIPLYNQSLATSGTYKRSWQNSGKTIHHILDKSGRQNPDTDILSISVIHDDGSYAEAYTKVLLSVEYEEALKILNEREIKFVAIKQSGQIIKKI